jgi:hypothetical protein
MKNKKNALYRTISQTVSLAVFIMAGIFNVSYGQAKVEYDTPFTL